MAKDSYVDDRLNEAIHDWDQAHARLVDAERRLSGLLIDDGADRALIATLEAEVRALREDSETLLAKALAMIREKRDPH